jgi:transcription initiation factor TFIIA small subunit
MSKSIPLYRYTTIAECLEETIDQFVSRGQLSPEMKARFMEVFDAKIEQVLSDKTTLQCSLRGSLHTYRQLNSVWTFFIQNAQIISNKDTFNAKMLRIVTVGTSSSRLPAKRYRDP